MRSIRTLDAVKTTNTRKLRITIRTLKLFNFILVVIFTGSLTVHGLQWQQNTGNIGPGPERCARWLKLLMSVLNPSMEIAQLMRGFLEVFLYFNTYATIGEVNLLKNNLKTLLFYALSFFFCIFDSFAIKSDYQ